MRWRSDGRELYYIDFDERLTAAPVAYSSDGTRIMVGKPTPLFRVRMPAGTVQPGGVHQQYVPSPDGQRFLVNTLLPEPNPAPITLILNWRGKP